MLCSHKLHWSILGQLDRAAGLQWNIPPHLARRQVSILPATKTTWSRPSGSVSAICPGRGLALCSHLAPRASPQIAEVPFGGGGTASFGRAVWKFCNGVGFLLEEGARGEWWDVLAAQGGPHGVVAAAQLSKPTRLYLLTSGKGEREE